VGASIRALTIAVLGWLISTPAVNAESVDQGSKSAAAQESRDVQGIFLGSAEPFKTAVDAAVGKRVRQALAGGLNPQGESVYLTAEQLQASLGTADLHPNNERMESVDVEIVAPRALQEDSGEAIPFGLASLIWATSHPSQAWRLLVPVTAARDPTDIEGDRLGGIHECYAPCRSFEFQGIDSAGVQVGPD